MMSATSRLRTPPVDLVFHETRLSAETARLAHGSGRLPFVNDQLDSATIELSPPRGATDPLRCAGFNNVDLCAARHGISVARVPAYSPYAVAEHAVALALTLNRKLHRAYNRVLRAISLGMVGFDMPERQLIVGTGQIGTVAARILSGFGCRLLAFDRLKTQNASPSGALYRSSDAVQRKRHHLAAMPADRPPITDR